MYFALFNHIPSLLVTTVSFPSTNPADHAEKIIPKPIDYHHLESNRALPYPLQQTTCSEAQHSYKIPIEDTEEYARKKGESIENRNARREDNKSTHYVAGYCPSLRQTEQVCSFFSSFSIITLFSNRCRSLVERAYLISMLERLFSQAPLPKDTILLHMSKCCRRRGRNYLCTFTLKVLENIMQENLEIPSK